MSKIVEVKEKGRLTRNKYIDLTEEERLLVRNDKINQADNEQIKEFDFVQYITDIHGTYVHAREGLNNRFFHLDSVKKSKKSIKEAKIIKRKVKKHGKTKSN
jgi:hypothetical protein